METGTPASLCHRQGIGSRLCQPSRQAVRRLGLRRCLGDDPGASGGADLVKMVLMAASLTRAGGLSDGAAEKNEKFRRYRHDNVWRLGLGWIQL